MTQVSLVSDLAKWFTVFTFSTSIVLAIFYGSMFRWWETVTGRTFFALFPSMAGALLHQALIIFGVPTVHLRGATPGLGPWYDAGLTWLSVIGLGGSGACLSILVWEALRTLRAEAGDTTRLANVLLKLGNRPRV